MKSEIQDTERLAQSKKWEMGHEVWHVFLFYLFIFYNPGRVLGGDTKTLLCQHPIDFSLENTIC